MTSMECKFHNICQASLGYSRIARKVVTAHGELFNDESTYQRPLLPVLFACCTDTDLHHACAGVAG